MSSCIVTLEDDLTAEEQAMVWRMVRQIRGVEATLSVTGVVADNLRNVVIGALENAMRSVAVDAAVDDVMRELRARVES